MTDRRHLDDVTVMVAGQGGDGSLTVITLLARLLAGRGFHMYSARNVASRIKGGHAAAVLRGSHAERGGLGDAIDVLVAFDDEAIERARARLAADAIVVYDDSAGPPPGLPEGVLVVAVPFARLAVRDLRRDLYKNSLAFGLLTRVLGVSDADAEECLRDRFAHLPEHLRDANLRALRRGLGHADERGIAEGDGPRALASAAARPRMLISGNEAVAMGFLAAGGRFFTGYPITPASEILDWLAAHLPRFGGLAVQAEDELAAVNLAIGAALTGVRAMTATSGPGLSLMQEGVAHLGSAEIPLVVVDCQRAGPSTGMPTKAEQSDLDMLVHGGNGDFPRIVLAPGGAADCFELAVTATNLARRLQCPVYLALDQALAQHAETVEPFDLEVPIEEGEVLGPEEVAALTEYRRYAITDSGISPWVVPGTPGGMNLVTGNERTEWGLVSIDPGNRTMMMDKRMRKVERARGRLPEGRRGGDPAAEVGMLGIGLATAAIREAAERIMAAGLPVAWLAPRTVWPVPAETLEFVAARRVTYVVEHNAEGQLAHLLGGAGGCLDRLRSVLRYDGTPFPPGELAGEILAGEGRT